MTSSRCRSRKQVEFFRDHPKIHRPLSLLDRVGLGYMKLGQPSTTLSGGEAQRIKLAAELKRSDTGKTLYLLDEPTTGLHFEDVRSLLATLGELVGRGNTVIVIEHSTDVMKVADYIIDLGPEAGDGGGRIIAQGTPEEVSRAPGSHTAAALREALQPRKLPKSRSRGEVRPAGGGVAAADIHVRGARQHNLKSIDVRIPRHSLTVVTGVSGSGKTSLALDTIFAEGQRRYLESLSTYARRFLGRMQGAECDAITGLSPAIAIDQKSASSNPRSTVATITEVHDYLRLLFARVGKPHCTVCGEALAWTSPSRLAEALSTRDAGKRALVLAPLKIDDGAVASGDGELLRRVEGARSALLRDGFTRVLAGGEEVRLDDDADAPVRRMLSALRRGREAGEMAPAGTAALPTRSVNEGIFVVLDRVVLGEASQTRLASSLEQAFEHGGGTAAVLRVGGTGEFHTRVPSCPHGHVTLAGDLTPSMFSFSSLQGACPRCRGLGVEQRVDESLLFPHPDRAPFDAMDPGARRFLEACRPSALRLLRAVLQQRRISPHVTFAELNSVDRLAILHGEGLTSVLLEIQGGSVLDAAWKGLVPSFEEWANEGSLGPYSLEVERLYSLQTCRACQGGRLRPESLAVRVGGRNVRELTALKVTSAAEALRELELTERERVIAGKVLEEIQNRLEFLKEVGLGYLTLDRTAGTLSGGESQRIRLASQLGNRLAGVLYVLDEPTVGLHPRDTRRLIDSLEGLRSLGNTVVLVEHDREVIEAADWVIDMGPGAGERGGRVLAAAPPAELPKFPASITGRYLARGAVADLTPPRRSEPTAWLEMLGVRRHNVRGVDVRFPLGVLTAVTGVSGSGKSTLVLEVLAEAVQAALDGRPVPPDRLDAARGLEAVRRLVVVDQKPIGRSPRSNPATYTGLWDHVRELFAMLPVSRVRGWGPDRFSFNTGGGRCMSCEGQGSRQIEMHFCRTCGCLASSAAAGVSTVRRFRSGSRARALARSLTSR
jgi:excinuclease ABC subunit A